MIVRQVIDGQQRLPTLQIFLAALRDFARSEDCEEVAKEVDRSLFNSGMMENKDIDKFKVWPTQLDRTQFVNVIDSGSFAEVQSRYPTTRKKYARKPDPKPRMVEAYEFFFEALSEFFKASAVNSLTTELSDRLDQCFQTLKSALLVVVIDLDQGDDPQVIFETLNARGEPLLPADLIRNYIFLRAKRDKLNPEELYDRYWAGFDDLFWREEIKQGRLNRARSDIFFQHFLSHRQTQDIPIKHLYVEYKHWSESSHQPLDVAAELELVSRQSENYRRLLSAKPDDPVCRLGNFVQTFEVSTLYPLILGFFEAKPADEEWSRIADILEAYIVRRTICDQTTKNYNRFFLSLHRRLNEQGFTPDNLYAELRSRSAESNSWPNNEQFREGWLRHEVYRPLGNARLVHILSRLNDCYLSTKSEPLKFSKQPTIEHIMPQSWLQHWPLENGDQGMTLAELNDAVEGNMRADATRRRDKVVQTMGNLTILSQALNASESNLGWTEKRPALQKHSLLPINQNIASQAKWDESSIRARGLELYDHAQRIWFL